MNDCILSIRSLNCTYQFNHTNFASISNRSLNDWDFFRPTLEGQCIAKMAPARILLVSVPRSNDYVFQRDPIWETLRFTVLPQSETPDIVEKLTVVLFEERVITYLRFERIRRTDSTCGVFSALNNHAERCGAISLGIRQDSTPVVEFCLCCQCEKYPKARSNRKSLNLTSHIFNQHAREGWLSLRLRRVP